MKTWTKDEIDTLIKYFEQSTTAEIQQLIPNKTAWGIYKKAYKLGLRRNREAQFKNRVLGQKKVPLAQFQKNAQGYILVHRPNHKRADKYGRIFEHIVVWEEFHNQEVPQGYVIHHINGKKDDNRIENLMMLSNKEHTALHNRARAMCGQNITQ